MHNISLTWLKSNKISINKKIKWFAIIGLIITLFPVSTRAQKTDWIKSEDRKQNYSLSEYLIGFSSGKNYDESTEDDLLQTHLQYAKQKMVESIFNMSGY